MLKTPKRNRYFRGKLLDVDHFELEQSYFNEKRWLINRLGIGGGVLDGLTCEPFGDGQTVRIEPGVAIDAAGREIILCEPSAPFDPRRLTDVDGNPTSSRVEVDGVVRVALHFVERGVDPMPSFDDACGAESGCSASAFEERYAISVRPLRYAESARKNPGTGVSLAEIQLPGDGSDVTINNDIRTSIESNVELLERILALESSSPQPQAPTVIKTSWRHAGELSAKELSEQGLEITFSEPISVLPNPMGWLKVTIEYPFRSAADGRGFAGRQPTGPFLKFSAETIAEQRLLVVCRLVDSDRTQVSLQVSPKLDQSFRQLCAEMGCQENGALCRVSVKCGALANLHDHKAGKTPSYVVPKLVGITGSDFESWLTLRPSL
ncbi:hypothetical protein [Thiococcus pfennigii]|uniref:hypothetical protein n=1 Tax=Thiococcus pfennigii TaxID=1057 RepID=UPI001908922E|nr:hypothetical protein [Thiococcus pfennigii]MBK1699376.1 hypothetical protein [Thiococcus pfennigii]